MGQLSGASERNFILHFKNLEMFCLRIYHSHYMIKPKISNDVSVYGKVVRVVTPVLWVPLTSTMNTAGDTTALLLPSLTSTAVLLTCRQLDMFPFSYSLFTSLYLITKPLNLLTGKDHRYHCLKPSLTGREINLNIWKVKWPSQGHTAS